MRHIINIIRNWFRALISHLSPLTSHLSSPRGGWVGVILLTFISCERVPPLHLHRGNHIEIPVPVVDLDLNVYWTYEVDYDWAAEWTYGWDEKDTELFGYIGYTQPNEFELRRYFLYQNPEAKHTTVEPFYVYGTYFKTEYNFGYYDMLVWNNIKGEGGVQSLIIDEETTLDSVMAFTNMGMTPSPYHAPAYTRAFNQPEELFAGYGKSFYISDNWEDYDYYDEATNTYYKHLDMELHPVTYIYLTQVRLHHNRGRVDGCDGEANLSGMARGVTLNTGVSSKDPITVHYNTNFKRNCPIRETGELVDIAGGRCLTFGITNQNSSRATRADIHDNIRHYMDVNLIFNNGLDSTFVFDVTDQVRKRFKGGVITIDLDVDTIKIPSRSGGSGFDAVVKDFDEEQYEFDM